MTRQYEALIIVKAAGTDAEVARAVAQVEALLKKLGARVEQTQAFGRRRLAYRIARQTEGHYHFVVFHMAPAQLDELKRQLRLNDTVVRYLILSRAPAKPAAAPPGPPSTPAGAGAPKPAAAAVASA